MRFRPLFGLFVAAALYLPNVLGPAIASPLLTGVRLESVVQAALLWAVCIFLWPKLWHGLLFMAPAALVWPMEVWVRLTQDAPISSHLVALAWETGWDEGSNFLTAYGYWLLVVALAWLAAYALAMYWAMRDPWRWPARVRIWVLAICLPALLWLYLPSGNPPANPTQSVADVMLGDKIQGWESQWDTVFPVNVWVSVNHYRRQRQGLESLRQSLAQRTLHGRLLNPDVAPDLVVLVIGESVTSTHWGALGYSRDTTPRISAAKNAIVFSDVVALSAATRSAVPGVLSRKPVLSPDDHVDLNAEPSLVKAFAEAGYKTFWLSNQAPLGRHDTSIGLYAHGAEHVRFLNPSTYETQGSAYDQALLAPFRAALKHPGRKLIVLHLLGSHFDYAQRYPVEFDYFRPSSQLHEAAVKKNKDDEAQLINNSYDNSIRYTDHILGELISDADVHADRAVITYFSDHGVDPNVGKCSSQTGGRRSESAFRVPVMWWASDRMQAANSHQWQALRKNAALPYTTRALYSTLLQISSIGIDGNFPVESLLKAPAAAPRMVSVGNRLVDFDAARKQNSCLIGQ